MAMSTRDRRAVILGGAALLLVFGYRYAVSPFVGTWREARARIAFADEQASGLEAQVTQLAAQKRLLEPALGAAASKPLKPVEETRLEFVKVVEELLQQNGLKSQGVRAQPVVTVRDLPGVAIVALQVQSQGQAQQVAQCLSKLGDAEKLILVQKLELAPDAQRPDQMQVTMVLATLAEAGGNTR